MDLKVDIIPFLVLGGDVHTMILKAIRA